MINGKYTWLRSFFYIEIIIGLLLTNCNPAPVNKGESEENATRKETIAEFGEELNPKLKANNIPTAIYSTVEPYKKINIFPKVKEDYLTNPGIGWQDGPESFGLMNFPETVSYANRRDIAWSELNPAEGVYNWFPLNEQIEKAVEAGKQFSFRIYTHVGEGYDGIKVPSWVINEGARILPSGEPDYSNCVYQEEWGRFINELIRNYDGNPDIAFIDISGYGNFNEWSWQDSQTEWDDRWDEDYSNGTASGASFHTLDGQARRRLVDLFVGGSFNGHTCRKVNGDLVKGNYQYPGFRKTQLVMPYAGIIQSSQYVLSRRNDVGFRYDCLGRDGQHFFEKVGAEIMRIWKKAPVVFELCKPNETDYDDAVRLLKQTHGSIVHNNNWSFSREQLEEMMLPVGYRYFLKQGEFNITGRQVDATMEWENIGLAPNYPKMGQDFRLYLCLVDESGKIVFKDPISTNIPSWLPADSILDKPPIYKVSYKNLIPSSIKPGKYQVGVTMIDLETGLPILLSFEGRDENGVYLLFPTEIK
jgi:hypothetical protein